MSVSDHYEFVEKDGIHRISVKKEFLATLPDKPENIMLYELFENYNIQKFFHNPVGPALVNLKFPGVSEEYFINGEHITDEEQVAKIKHNNAFNQNFDQMLKKED